MGGYYFCNTSLHFAYLVMQREEEIIHIAEILEKVIF